MSRTRTNKRKQSNNERMKALAMLVVCVGFVGTVLYNYFLATQNEIALDKTTLCRLDGDFPRETVILLDATESLSEAHTEAVLNRIESEIENSYLYERFSIYSLQDDPTRFQPQFVLCNPGDGKDKSYLTAAPKKIFEQWRLKFRDPILNEIKSLELQKSSESSPVMEMLKFVGLRTMARSDSSKKRIILVSDMVENTDKYSQYTNSNMDFNALKDTSYFREVRPRLNEVHVELLYIERGNLSGIQGKDHIQKFWKPFIEQSKGLLSSVTNIN
tara:strand:+ start:303 stop:1121 length:819 start_codon:yes stop_codon:yes gene_type:complete